MQMMNQAAAASKFWGTAGQEDDLRLANVNLTEAFETRCLRQKGMRMAHEPTRTRGSKSKPKELRLNSCNGVTRTKFVAAVMRAHGKPLKIESLELDPPRADEVLVRLVATGICHTDIAVHHREDSPLPSILGHEGAGVVEAVGAAVRKVKSGDHVVLSFMSCGRCRQCQSGEPAYCEKLNDLNFTSTREDGSVSAHGPHGPVCNHFFGQSSFATYTLANERNVVKVPKSLRLEVLGPLGCGVQTGAGAVMNSLKVKAGDSFACFGTGSVGLSAIMAAQIVGATTIIGVDVSDERLRVAKRLGATHVINARKKTPATTIREITGGTGVDYCFDTTGVDTVFNEAIEALGIRGTLGYVTGGAKPERTFNARSFMAAGKRMMGILEGDAVPDVFIPHLITLYRQGRFPFDKMVKFYPLREINRAFADSKSGKTIKPVIRLTGATHRR
jgi:aryl-alcohol dehydrogenase